MNPETANLIDRLRQTRESHLALRDEQPSANKLQSAAPVYELLKSLFDELWKATQRFADKELAKSVQSHINALTLDVEYYSGRQMEAEGYRNNADVERAYESIQEAFKV